MRNSCSNPRVLSLLIFGTINTSACFADTSNFDLNPRPQDAISQPKTVRITPHYVKVPGPGVRLLDPQESSFEKPDGPRVRIFSVQGSSREKPGAPALLKLPSEDFAGEMRDGLPDGHTEFGIRTEPVFTGINNYFPGPGDFGPYPWELGPYPSDADSWKYGHHPLGKAAQQE
jgi:hypothetical protein